MASSKRNLLLLGTALVVLAIGLVAALHAVDAGGREESSTAPHNGWDRLLLPPEVRDGSSFLPTNDQILVFGGCGERPKYDCRATRDGFAYSPAESRWTRMPKALFGPMGESVWTGDEAIFLNTGTGYKRAGSARPIRALSFDPVNETWQRLPRAPLRVKDSDAVWTGTEVIVWGGGGRKSPSAADGAAYNPSTDQWRKIARAPISLNNVNLAWTGTEMIAFGSRLDFGNHASARVAIGAAYDPTSDSWRRITDSKLSPQAETTAWAGGRLVAYDYGPNYQLYNPTTDSWSPKRPMPLRFGECYPDSAATPDGVIANFCGQVATYDSAGRRWSKVPGGMTRRKLDNYHVNFWGQASLAILDGTAYFLATGYSTGPSKGPLEFARSFWSYSPRSGEG